MITLILYLFLALVVSFICSISEAVILSVSKAFIDTKVNEGKRGAKLLDQLKSDIDRPLAAILSVNTVAHTIGAAGVGAQAVAVFGEVYFGIISAVLTLLILIFSEIIPKTIGAMFWRELSIPSARVINGMIYVSYPLVVLSEYITKLIARKREISTLSREEITALANLGTAEGVLEKSESKIISNLISLRKIKVKNVMTPRTVAMIAPEDITIKDYISNKKYLQFSRIPVYSESPDHITGYILNSEALENFASQKGSLLLKDIRRKIIFIYENVPIPKLFEELLKEREHIAAVANEHGGIEGIVTMEDIIESLLGLEIMDEKDIEVDMQQLAKRRWRFRKRN